MKNGEDVAHIPTALLPEPAKFSMKQNQNQKENAIRRIIETSSGAPEILRRVYLWKENWLNKQENML